MNEINLVVENNQTLVSSRQVAEDFGKRHDKLKYEITRMYGGLIGVHQNGGHPMFIENKYIHEQNKQVYVEYLMNRDDFHCLNISTIYHHSALIRCFNDSIFVSISLFEYSLLLSPVGYSGCLKYSGITSVRIGFL